MNLLKKKEELKESAGEEELKQIIEDLGKRISLLENNNKRDEQNINNMGLNYNQEVEYNSNQVKSIMGEISNIKKDLTNISRHIDYIISELKKKSTNGDFLLLKKKTDSWSPEELISKREFKRIIKNNLRV